MSSIAGKNAKSYLSINSEERQGATGFTNQKHSFSNFSHPNNVNRGDMRLSLPSTHKPQSHFQANMNNHNIALNQSADNFFSIQKHKFKITHSPSQFKKKSKVGVRVMEKYMAIHKKDKSPRSIVPMRVDKDSLVRNRNNFINKTNQNEALFLAYQQIQMQNLKQVQNQTD